MRFRTYLILAAFVLMLVLPASAQQYPAGIVVSDTPLATEAGMKVLQQGGNAVDAAVATAFALGVVSPAGSGLGGGGLMVIYQSKERKAHALDFRETAPAAAREDMYVRDGKIVGDLSLKGSLAVAVPGHVAGLAEASKRFGDLSLETVLGPAIQYATEGFAVHAPLFRAVNRHRSAMLELPNFSRIFLKADGSPYKEGEILRQPELGQSLRAIARDGPRLFYEGWIASAIAGHMQQTGGILTAEDLKSYKPVWRGPLLGNYRKWLVVTMPPPSSGGIALIEMLNVLQSYRLTELGHNSSTYLHLLAETSKHAFADRAQYLGDPDFVKIPTFNLLSKNNASRIRTRISSVRTHGPDYYGLATPQEERGGTTHFGVLDRNGNAVACSLTINTTFGAKVLVRETGIILNNEMDDFSISPGIPNTYGLVGGKANSIQPNKRPLSSMTPTIILQDDRPMLIVGGSGGPRIISGTLQTILNVLDFNMPVTEAVATPRIHHQWKPDSLMVERDIPASIKASLKRRGHKVQQRRSVGTVQAVLVKQGNISGAADPRRTRPRVAPDTTGRNGENTRNR